MFKIVFLQQNKIYTFSRESELKHALALHPEMPLRFGCRQGHCATCAIKVVDGMENLSRPTKEEKETLSKKGLSDNYRLACQCVVLGDVTIDG